MDTALKSSLWTDLAIVITGRAFGQGILFLSTLYCAAFFDPSAFGLLGLFTAIVAILAQLSAGRCDVIALACKTKHGTKRFIGLSYKLNLIVFSLLIVFSGLAVAMGAALIWLALPFAVIANSVIQYILPAQMTSIGQRQHASRPIGLSAASTALFQVLAAWVSPTANALILTRMAGPTIGGVSAWQECLQGFRYAMKTKLTARIVKPVWRELTLGGPSAIMTILGFQVPVYFLTALDEMDQVGYYWLGFNLLLTPYLVVAASFRPIFARLVVEKIKLDGADDFLRWATVWAVLVGFASAFGLALGAHYIIEIALGSAWAASQPFVTSVAIMMVGLIATTPLNAAATALRQRRAALIINAAQLVMRAIAIAAAYALTQDTVIAIQAFAITSLTLSFLYCAVMVWPAYRASGAAP
ncbi:lipopolysaccharide biosynthesis protein [Pseudaestuariivita rosea]|uniref:lipopolysaccharide biosynthesis protein n=1 Tax=Pseudaestuariivita rosea TaxID=2763263 RepID=UPI001ABBB6F0|nr:hypothetical protein [Pseudaestuariivita rosea]